MLLAPKLKWTQKPLLRMLLLHPQGQWLQWQGELAVPVVAVDAVGGPLAVEDGWGGEVVAHQEALGPWGVPACAP